MKDYKMYFKQEELEDEEVKADNFLNRFGPMLADEMKKNPQFLECLKRALDSQDLELNIKISEDGRNVIIRSNVGKEKTGNPDLQDNISFKQTRISLDEKNNMYVSDSRGTMYNFDDYKKIGDEKMANMTSSQTPTVLSVYHAINGYTPDGIECQWSSFSDSCPLQTPRNSQALIYETLNSHYPNDWKQNTVSEGPRTDYDFSPNTSYAFRYINSLGVALFTETEGKPYTSDFKFTTVSCPVHSEHPENMLVLTQSPLANVKSGKYEMTEWAKATYPDKTYEQLESEFSKDYSIRFLKTLENSGIKESSPELYNSLREKALKGLGTDYIDKEKEEVEESHGMKM